MSGKTKRRTRRARTHSASNHASLRAVGPRRLSVECVEDRRLLSAGTFQTGIELSLTPRGGASDPMIVIIANPNSTTTNATQGTGRGAFTSPDGGTTAYDHAGGIAIIEFGNSTISRGEDMLRITVADPTGESPAGGMIDVGRTPAKFAGPTAPISVKAGDSPLVRSEDHAPPSFESAVRKVEVDGAHGVLQAFEIAMMSEKQSNSDNLKPHREIESLSPAELRSAEQRPTQRAPHELVAVEKSVASRPAQAERAFADSFVGSGEHEPAVSIAAALTIATPEVASSIGLPTRDAAAAASPAGVVSATSNAVVSTGARQAVFAEFGRVAAKEANSPYYLGEHRSRDLCFTAVVALIAQPLLRKRKQSPPTAEAEQNPPRRRNSPS
jgi:hypothetical protein